MFISDNYENYESNFITIISYFIVWLSQRMNDKEDRKNNDAEDEFLVLPDVIKYEAFEWYCNTPQSYFPTIEHWSKALSIYCGVRWGKLNNPQQQNDLITKLIQWCQQKYTNNMQYKEKNNHFMLYNCHKHGNYTHTYCNPNIEYYLPTNTKHCDETQWFANNSNDWCIKWKFQSKDCNQNWHYE